MLLGLIAGLLAAVIILILRSYQAKKAPKLDNPDSPFNQNKRKVLAYKPSDLGIEPGSYDHVYGVAFEWRTGYEVTFLAAFSNGISEAHFNQQKSWLMTTPNPKIEEKARNTFKLTAPHHGKGTLNAEIPMAMGRQFNWYFLTDEGVKGLHSEIKDVNRKGHELRDAFRSTTPLFLQMNKLKKKLF